MFVPHRVSTVYSDPSLLLQECFLSMVQLRYGEGVNEADGARRSNVYEMWKPSLFPWSLIKKEVVVFPLIVSGGAEPTAYTKTN